MCQTLSLLMSSSSSVFDFFIITFHSLKLAPPDHLQSCTQRNNQTCTSSLHVKRDGSSLCPLSLLHSIRFMVAGIAAVLLEPKFISSICSLMFQLLLLNTCSFYWRLESNVLHMLSNEEGGMGWYHYLFLRLHPTFFYPLIYHWVHKGCCNLCSSVLCFHIKQLSLSSALLLTISNLAGKLTSFFLIT